MVQVGTIVIYVPALRIYPSIEALLEAKAKEGQKSYVKKRMKMKMKEEKEIETDKEK